MNKEELKALAERHKMEIGRDSITGEAWGLYVVTERLIPELDEYVERIAFENLVCLRLNLSTTTTLYQYKIYVRNGREIFDKYGFKTEGGESNGNVTA